uniref:Uncharacterized protein n=1 Tax=Callorhinchus milii TaxID=7868 RepID=A0A4W3GKU1_CALMI
MGNQQHSSIIIHAGISHTHIHTLSLPANSSPPSLSCQWWGLSIRGGSPHCLPPAFLSPPLTGLLQQVAMPCNTERSSQPTTDYCPCPLEHHPTVPPQLVSQDPPPLRPTVPSPPPSPPPTRRLPTNSSDTSPCSFTTSACSDAMAPASITRRQ